ncbi:mismatch-specific DNA-glycosylase [Neoactinobaculum massilliense]|uniref:mismatch-specific DNA-glycosylase n=1 Tax=Neoactinobaculum massilliense TaxID=2364794 RepID=UPI000F53DAA3|nr:mismatch-specific DNA-glycosylase [Neoactinobaculum massilliense]
MRISPLGGRRPKRAELADFVGRPVDPIVTPHAKLLIVGINPGLWTAAVNAPFAAPSNRFWPSLAASGLLPRRVDAAAGLSAEDEAMVQARGIGLTNLVDRATAKASELSREELAAGYRALGKTVAQMKPRVVAILGITAYRDATGRKKAKVGPQLDAAGAPRKIGSADLWVLPQPSGLNAHATLPVLVEWWHRVADAAGMAYA